MYRLAVRVPHRAARVAVAAPRRASNASTAATPSAASFRSKDKFNYVFPAAESYYRAPGTYEMPRGGVHGREANVLDDIQKFLVGIMTGGVTVGAVILSYKIGERYLTLPSAESSRSVDEALELIEEERRRLDAAAAAAEK